MAHVLAPGSVGVKTIRTDDLEPNPHNPRRLFDPEPLNTLKESIAKVGILVPLTVYWSKSRKVWVILDGQRRWICAQNLRLKTVPANEVAEPSLVQNIVTMFQIHRLREDWELMPTALTLDILMSALKERRDGRLAELTGLDRAVVVRCKKLLSPLPGSPWVGPTCCGRAPRSEALISFDIDAVIPHGTGPASMHPSP